MLVKLLQQMCPPCTVLETNDLATDAGRYKLAQKVGRNSVCIEFEAALSRQQREAKEPK